jgi:hypothetical protein
LLPWSFFLEDSVDGLSRIGSIGPIAIIEEPFDSGEEEQFESIIEHYPNALPISEINPLAKVAVPIGRQVTVGNNSLDLLFLDDTGSLLAIECKLIQNPEARREVVAQVIEYGMTIEKDWDVEKVRAIADGYLLGKNLEGGVIGHLNRALEQAGYPSVPEKSLIQKLRSKFKRPYLVVAGNRLDQRALVLSDYLKKKIKLPIVCTEFRRYKVGETQFILGYVRCASLLSTTSSGQRQAISEEEWLSLYNTEPLISIRQDLLQWVKDLEGEGSGLMRIGSKELMFDIMKGDSKKNVLSISNRVYFYFGNLRILGAQDDAIESFRRYVNDVLGLGVLTSRTEYPSIPLTALAEAGKREKIKEQFKELLRLAAASRVADASNDAR